jgi:chemotaxis protein methyltransferase CheR
MHTITDNEFGCLQRFIFDAAGISLSAAKKALVCGRLAKRLQAYEFHNYTKYIELLSSGKSAQEVQMAVDLLTTNETYFFRESKHFELLRTLALAAAPRSQPFRVWSAASSTGEEGYSIAMVLADCLGDAAWEVVGTDISSRVLARARNGHYPLERAKHIPATYLKRFCLKGYGPHAGTLLINRPLRSRVSFAQVNLNTELPRLGSFDLIFLRNVLIYFNADTKRSVVKRLLAPLKPGGHFFIGHSESLNEISTDVQQVAPSIYRKP